MTKVAKKVSDTSIDAVLASVPEKLPIEDMPLTTLEEYKAYNAEARKLNKKLKICRYPIKQCPIDLHPKERIIFGRVDQPSNYAPVYLSNDDIEFRQKLYPGKTYDLPRCVIDFLAEKGTPVWKWFDNADGSKETRVSHKVPRFALRTVYQD
jgi:hypothetical protein